MKLYNSSRATKKQTTRGCQSFIGRNQSLHDSEYIEII